MGGVHSAIMLPPAAAAALSCAMNLALHRFASSQHRKPSCVPLSVQRRPQLAFSVQQRCTVIDVRHALHTPEVVLV